MSPEFDLIARFAAMPGADRADVVLGIGDDAAIVTPRPWHELVMCTDTLVAGVHFPDATSPESIGHKALAVNLSDLAAMGAEPCWALLSLTLPGPDADWIDGFVTGFSGLAHRFGIKLVGGDTTRGPLTITVQAIGQVPAGTAIQRTGSRPGDLLCVTGTLGDAALALAGIKDGGPIDAVLRERLDRPVPRVETGMALRGLAHAAIDVSDGLLADLGHMLHRDGLGATVEVDRLPASKAFLAGQGTRSMQLAGGDDYELLFTIPKNEFGRVERLDVSCIGTINEQPGVRCIAGDGTMVEIGRKGYEHFAD